MEQIFIWMASLTQSESIGYAILVCLILLFIPFSDIFFKLCRKIVLVQKLNIKHFGYTLHPDVVSQIDNAHSLILKQDHPDFVIEGSKIMLHWLVEGALWVKLYPGIGKVNGNAAEVLVNRSRRHFTLEARGLFSTKRIEIEIPLHKVKKLDVTELSDVEIQTQVKKVSSFAFSDSRLLCLNFTSHALRNHSFTKLQMHITSNLVYALPDGLVPNKARTQHMIESQKILKSYTFSTRKYNAVNHIKPINFKQL
jgi:hypothetical protein